MLKLQKVYQYEQFLWNAGIFIWNVSTIVNAFRIYQPGIARIFQQLFDVLGTPEEHYI